MKAIGLIEVKGIVGAIEAADIALKTAQIELVSRQKVRAGINVVTFEGDVGAVKAAVEAATTAVAKLGVLMTSHVIARPDDSVEPLLKRKDNIKETRNETIEIKAAEIQKIEIEETPKIEEIEEGSQEINEILKVNKNKKNKNKK